MMQVATYPSAYMPQSSAMYYPEPHHPSEGYYPSPSPYPYSQPPYTASPPGYPSYSQPASVPGNALMLYSPNTLHGLFYHQDLHGPFANPKLRNPFTPGLDPGCAASAPRYEVEDPLMRDFPARRTQDDPLNWITQEIFDVSTRAEHVAHQRAPLSARS